MVHRALLRRNLELAPAQPATALWRAIEVEHLFSSRVLPAEGRGLDLGCGDGAVTALIRDTIGARWRLVGVDPDPAECSLAAARGLYERVLEAEGSAVDEPDMSFDFVLSNSVLEHIESLESTLHEMRRLLKIGGKFIFTVPSEFFHENLGRPGLLGLIATSTRDVLEYRKEIDRRLGHVRYLTVDEWRAALASAGLGLDHASVYMSRVETRRWAILSNATAGLLVRVTGRRTSPIEIQRRLAIRRAEPPALLRRVGRALGEVGAAGLAGDPNGVGRGSCLLAVAYRPGS